MNYKEYATEEGYRKWKAIIQKIAKSYRIPEEMYRRDAYDWAVMTLLSRGIFLDETSWRKLKNMNVDPYMQKDQKGIALFPMYDLVNHKPLPKALRPSNVSIFQMVST